MKHRIDIFFLSMIALLVLSPLSVQAWTADQIDFPGDSQTWVLTLDSSKYTGPDGYAEWFRYGFTAGADLSDYNFKMVTGNDWNQDYGGNTSFTKNEVDILYYQPTGDTAAKLTGGLTSGYRYVFTVKNPGLADTFISVMELSGDYVSIDSVSGVSGTLATNEAATLTVHLSATPPVEQKVYIRFTQDSWTSSAIVGTTIVGTNATAVITNLAESATYEWYALSSTASSNYLASTNGFSIDALTLTWDNNGGANYSFDTQGPPDLGNAWHVPANAEPVGTSMRSPQNAWSNDTVYIYNGNQFQGTGNAGDQTGGTLYHRMVGSGSWSSSALAYDSESGNNKYWLGTIPAGTYAATNEVEYSLAVTYSDHDTTYIGTTNSGSGYVLYADAATAQAHPFTMTYGGEPGTEAGFIWHNDNRVIQNTSNVQVWAKMGYALGTGSNAWVDAATAYYTTDGSDPVISGKGVAGNAATKVQSLYFNHMEEDSYENGDAMWWMGTLTNLPVADGSEVRYKIGAWKASGVERFAEYNTGTGNDTIFSFSLYVAGADGLQVNGVNADYTTSKFFIDEIAGESAEVVVHYQPEAGASNVQVYCNLGRRDLVDVDYSSALITGDGYPDGIKPPDGNLITTADTGAYYTAFAMVGGPIDYYWTGTVSKCGAYRITARYQKEATSATNWIWYSSEGRRDHAVVVSPRKVHDMTLYELNPLTVEATDNTEAGRSTFIDLLGASQGDSDGYDPFNLDYLNFIQANCLWFQPIHPSSITTRGDPSGYSPGSPYATRDYFAVSPYLGSAGTESSAMNEFSNFVAACDAYTGSVGTINIMLDGVFNHTSWDAEMGQGGVDLGLTANADALIGATAPGWYSLYTDYGEPATYYVNDYTNDFATAPDRGDFGKWDDVCEFYFGKYSALVRHNDENNDDYLNEEDIYDFAGMSTNTMNLWKYFGYYTEYWLKQTGHSGTNSFVQELDDKGIDGLRCDFGQGLPPQCWEYIINHTRSKKWNFIFMAETLDGGIPGFRSNRHFDILNEDIVFRFTQAHVNNSWEVRQALEDRRSSYTGGSVLLNITGHDEELPDSDAWLNASRYGALSVSDGLPMMFYGMEQGIQQFDVANPSSANDGFATDHELNFGKYIPQFKQWNQLTVWDNPPANNTGMAQWYGRVNWARLNSPALRSMNRYFLRTTDGDENSQILAVAKYETPYASPASSDVVLAFANLLPHGESHSAAADTYDLTGAWDLMGLDTGKYYQVRNLASSDASQYVWDRSKSGADLYENGLYVSLGAGTVNAITNDGELVQYLKIVETAAPNNAPVISVDGPFTVAVGSTWARGIGLSDSDGDTVLLSTPQAPAGYSLVGTNFSWTPGAAFENTTNNLVLVADDQQAEENSVVTNRYQLTVPYDSDADYVGDGYEWSSYGTLVNDQDSDTDSDGMTLYEEYISGTEPTNSSSVFVVSQIIDQAGQTNYAVTISTQPGKLYVIEYADANLTNNITWSPFADASNGVGTWTETNTVSSSYSFTDDFGPATTGGSPLQNRRYYRVGVRNP